jgi:uncharacterized membrane protein YtjA (UPF0391 family)
MRAMLRWWHRSDDAVAWTAAVLFYVVLLLWILHLILS